MFFWFYIKRYGYFWVLYLSLCLTFNILGHQWPSGRQRAVRIYQKRYYSMNSTFESQTDFKNASNWIYAFFVKFKICKHIRLHKRHGIYDRKKPSNLHKNSLFSKRYVVSHIFMMENYKWCFKKQFLSLVKHKHRPYVRGHRNFVIWAFTLAIMASHLLLLNSSISAEPSLGMYGSCDFHLLGLKVGNNLLHLLYLPIKAFARTILKSSNDMSLPSFM